MSPDELFLVAVLEALGRTGLEAIVVGSAAAALQGAPIMTQDLDLLVRDTPRNREKLDQLCAILGAGRPVRLSSVSTVETILGASLPIDIVYDELPGRLGFASVRSRSRIIPIGEQSAVVADLEDVIASKAAADRPKDRAQLPILKDTLRVKKALTDDDEV